MKIILSVFLLIFLNPVFAQETKYQEHFSLKGHVKGRDTGLIWLHYINKDEKVVVDSVWLNMGNFLFTGSVNGAANATLQGNKSRFVSDPNFTSLFIENTNMLIQLRENEFKSAKITGSKTQTAAEALEESKRDLLQQKEALNIKLTEMDNAITSGDTTVSTRKKAESIRAAYLACIAQIKQVDYAFMEEHPDSYLSSDLLYSYFVRKKLSLDSSELFFNKFTKENQTSTLGKRIKGFMVARRSSMVGASAPLFSLVDIDGKPIALEKFRNKNYVLLDFWASWCIPCRENTPEIIKLYQKHKGQGLEIISISLDTDKKAWLKAVEQDKTTWHHIIDPLPYQKEGLMLKYNASPIPLLLLIDKKGMIIGRYENNEMVDLTKQLQEVLK